MKFSLDGNAKSGRDFTAVGTSVTFPAGSRRVNVPIVPTRKGGKTRTLILDVEESTGYRSGELRQAIVQLSN